MSSKITYDDIKKAVEFFNTVGISGEELKKQLERQAMNQEMTEVPEYRQAQNAPSQNSEKEAYNKGAIFGYRKAIADIITVLEGMQNQFDSSLMNQCNP